MVLERAPLRRRPKGRTAAGARSPPVLPNEFTEQSGELTASFKVKRHVINERYAAQIEAMYA